MCGWVLVVLSLNEYVESTGVVYVSVGEGWEGIYLIFKQRLWEYIDWCSCVVNAMAQSEREPKTVSVSECECFVCRNER